MCKGIVCVLTMSVTRHTEGHFLPHKVMNLKLNDRLSALCLVCLFSDSSDNSDDADEQIELTCKCRYTH